MDERIVTTTGELAQREALLASRGLFVPGEEDLILGLYEQDELVAIGALVRGTAEADSAVIQGVAVNGRYEGEGLAATVVSRLVTLASQQGLWHLFLFTKPDEAWRFQSLGFSLVASADQAALLEWGQPDVTRAMTDLARHRRGDDGICLVINGNPFTKGHLWLVQQAAAQSRPLYVLVVQEDRSVVPFDVRFRLIAESCEPLGATVLSGGAWVVSSASFPSYFTKRENLSAAQAGLDAEIFGRHIAPALGVTERWVGTEPLSAVTAQYNKALARILPRWNVKLREVPRLEQGGQPVSASLVRSLLREDRLDDVKPLVPQITWLWLTSPEGKVFAEKLRHATESWDQS